MSELTITHNGVTQTAKEGFNQRKGIVKRINPTVFAGATNTDKVLFNTIEIPNAVRVKGGTAYIRSITLLSYDSEAHNISLFFMGKTVDVGNAGDTYAMGDKAASKAVKLLGGMKIIMSDGQAVAKPGTSVHSTSGFTGAASDRDYMPLMIQAEPNTTSIFMNGIASETVDFAATDELEILLHIEYLD